MSALGVYNPTSSDDGFMRRMLCALFVGALLTACAKRASDVKLAADSSALGASPSVDTIAAAAAVLDTSRAAAVRQATARSTLDRPARVYHATEEQQRLRQLRLEKPKTTVRRLEPVRRPANR